uniref:DUF659 domain-containing protein n=1 Tax=Solanum lycopersicum TaxID=4081 RepID=A0A3Q7ITV9_SOLLC
MFIESINASSLVKTEEKLCELLDRYVERVGEQNVVQTVSDNGSNFVLAARWRNELSNNQNIRTHNVQLYINNNSSTLY